jgi:hypothetical protein
LKLIFYSIILYSNPIKRIFDFKIRLAEIENQKMWIAQQKTELEELHHIHDTWVKEKDITESEVNRLRELNRGLRYKVAHPNNKPEANTLMVQLNSSNAVSYVLHYKADS